MKSLSVKRVRLLVVCSLLVLLSSPMLGKFAVHPARADSSARVTVDPPSIADLSITPGTIVTFTVDVSDAPAINGFLVLLTYNSNVLKALQIDYSGNVLKSTGKTLVLLRGCIDGVPIQLNDNLCQPTDAVRGVVSLAQTILAGTTSSPTNGLLFSVTFNVTAYGFSEIHLRDVDLSSGQIGPDGQPVPVPVSSSDGYFANIDCPGGSGVLCTPPIADFSFSPEAPVLGDVVAFNASSSAATDSGAVLTNYSWNWGDPLNPQTTGSIASHVFANAGFRPIIGRFLVTMSVTDTYGVSASKTRLVVVGPKPDFIFVNDIGGSVGGFSVLAGKTVTGFVNITGVYGFDGTVHFSISPAPLFGANATASPSVSDLILMAGQTVSIPITVSAPNNSSEGLELLTLTATSGPLTHSVFFTLTVQRPGVFVDCGFGSISSCSSLFAPFSILQGGNLSFPLFVERDLGYNGTVTLSVSTFCNTPYVVTAFTPDRVTLDEDHATVPVTVTIAVSEQAPLRTYCQDIRLSGLGITHTNGPYVDVSVVAPPFPPDFRLSTQPSLSIIAGSNATVALTVASLNGFTDNIVLFAAVSALRCSYASCNSYENPSANLSDRRISFAQRQTSVVSIEIAANDITIIGDYTVILGGHPYSSDPRVDPHIPDHVITMSLRIVSPPATPVNSQLHWKHRVSLSIPGLGKGTQTFVAGISNLDDSTTLFARLVVTGTDQTGTKTFTATSQIQTLSPLQSLTNIQITEAFDQSTVGSTFNFRVTIMWGVDPSALTQTTPLQSNEVHSGGSFAIVS